MPIRKEVGQNIRKERDRKRMSQEELAGLARTTQEYISRIENGTRNPSMDLLYNIAGALKCPVKRLVG